MENSAGAIIFYGREVLIIKSSATNDYGFPKGHLEKGETHMQAAKREIFEEVGLVVDIENISEEIKYSLPSGKNKSVTYFIAKSQTKKIILNGEISDYKWVDFEKVEFFLTHSDLREAYISLLKKIKLI